jgi:predicted transposase/invertase (TIGR01784 family)
MEINRRNDYAFKRIFGREDTKDILARFLSVVLDVMIEPEELTLIHTEISPEYLADKTSFLDVQVRRSERHEKMIVEMQARDERNIERRTLHYWGRSYTEELKESQDYAELPRVIHIVIANFDVFEWSEATKFHGIFQVRDREEGVLFSDALEIHVIELPKMRKRKKAIENYEPLEQWAAYLNNVGGETMERIAEKEPMLRKAMTIEEIFMKNEEERYFYELRERGRHDFESAVIAAEKRGKLEGKEEGKLETARSMLADAMAPDLIAKFTGLPVEQIEALRKES